MTDHPMRAAIKGIVKFLAVDPTPGTTPADLVKYHEDAAQFHRSCGDEKQAAWADQLAHWAREAIPEDGAS